MVKKRAIFSNYQVKKVGTIEYLKELGQLASGYENDLATGTAKGFQRFDCPLGNYAFFGKRAIKIGSKA